MNPLCLYCGVGDVATELNWQDSCTACVFECTTCHTLEPYERGVAWSSECDTCDYNSSNADTTPAMPLEIRLDSDMVFSIEGFRAVTEDTADATDTTQTTQQELGDTPMTNRLYTVVSFDDQSKIYQVVGTTTSQIEPEELIDLLGKDGEPAEFDNVIADFINSEMAHMVTLAQSKERASKSRMTRAEHKPVVMRIGEWNSVLHALRTLREIDLADNDIRVQSPHNYVPNGVSVSMLISVLELNLENASGVVGNNA